MDIREHLKDGFEVELYEASLRNLENSKNPIALNSFSFSLRELLRNFLSRTAPDSEVVRCCWFIPNEESYNGITRADRIKYGIQGGLEDEFVKEDLGVDLTPVISNMTKKFRKLNEYTHINEKTFNLNQEIVNSESEEILKALQSALDSYALRKTNITDVLWNNIDDSVVHSCISETIQSIDELSSHHSVEEVETHEVCVTQIDSEFIQFDAEGYLQCELQWGSNSDVRRGDGVVVTQSFPFTCILRAPVGDPYLVDTDPSSVRVDNSFWSQ